MKRFRNRSEAGEMLAGRLERYADNPTAIVLGLARGGVVVAAAVAAALRLPLDVLLVRKLGVPGREELAMGAIATGGVRVVNEDVLRALSLGEEDLQAAATRELRELERRESVYRGGRAMIDIAGKTVIVVDDGLATGASMRAAVIAVRAQNPAAVTVAVPVASREARDAAARMVDEVVTVATPEPFWGVGAWYKDFAQTSDHEVTSLLARHAAGVDEDGRAS